MTRPVTANPGHCHMRTIVVKRARGLLTDVIQNLPTTSAERAALEAAVRLTVQADETRTQELEAARQRGEASAALTTYTPPAIYAGPVHDAED